MIIEEIRLWLTLFSRLCHSMNTAGDRQVLQSVKLQEILFKLWVLCQVVDTWRCSVHHYCLWEARCLISHIFDIHWSLHFFSLHAEASPVTPWSVCVATEKSIEIWGTEKWWEKITSCRGGCVVWIKIGVDTWRCYCEKRSGGFIAYQRCDSSAILLLEVNTREHYTAEYPLVDIKPRFWIALFSARDFSKPACYQLSIEWQSSKNNASHSRVSSIIIIFHHPLWESRCWNRLSVSTGIKFHHSFNPSGPTISEIDVWCWSDSFVCAQPNRIFV